MRRIPPRLRSPSFLPRSSIPRSGPSPLHHYGPQSLRAPLSKPPGTWLRHFVSQSVSHNRRHGLEVPPEPTIFALSTAAGRAAIAIIRISGPACVEIYNSLCPNRNLPKPRYATLRTLYDPTQPPSSDSILDANALILCFPAPNTVTGEDLLELHVHGGAAVVKAVLNAIPKCSYNSGTEGRNRVQDTPPIRYAEPGEFTRRAFLNDRLDLTQIEALGDTLAADTEQQRRLAVRGANDTLGRTYQGWQRQLLYARGELEALIDFSEDQHFEESPRELVSSIAEQVLKLKRSINIYIGNAAKGELLRNGISIALLGAPNAGKSSLLNKIVGREAAIVSREEGTTRDIVDVGVDIGGWFCRLGDMAGLRSRMKAAGSGVESGRNAIGEVEQEGIRRAKQRAMESDVVVVVLSLEKDGNGEVSLIIEPEVIDATNTCLELGKQVLIAINKIDLSNDDSQSQPLSSSRLSTTFPAIPPSHIIPISCKAATAQATPSPLSSEQDPGNIQSLLHTLIQTFTAMSTASSLPDSDSTSSTWEASLGVSHRQRAQLELCLQHLNDFLEQASACPTDTYDGNNDGEVDIVAAAEHLRFAASCLARITGRGEGTGDVEEVLGVVFEKFCVGK